MKPYSCIEQTIEFSFKRIKIRLWIDITNNDPLDDQQVINDIKKFNQPEDKKQFLQFIADTIPHINAIQLIENNLRKSVGIVVYTTPFNDDVHG